MVKDKWLKYCILSYRWLHRERQAIPKGWNNIWWRKRGCGLLQKSRENRGGFLRKGRHALVLYWWHRRVPSWWVPQDYWYKFINMVFHRIFKIIKLSSRPDVRMLYLYLGDSLWCSRWVLDWRLRCRRFQPSLIIAIPRASPYHNVSSVECKQTPTSVTITALKMHFAAY